MTDTMSTGNLVLVTYVVIDWTSLLWVAGLLALGFALFVLEYALGNKTRPGDAQRGDPAVR